MVMESVVWSLRPTGRNWSKGVEGGVLGVGDIGVESVPVGTVNGC